MAKSVFVDSLRHDTPVFGWSPGSHESEENPFLATHFFLDNVEDVKRQTKNRCGKRIGPSIAPSWQMAGCLPDRGCGVGRIILSLRGRLTRAKDKCIAL